MTHLATPPPAGLLQHLITEGVSPWMEGLSRDMLQSGRLATLVADYDLRGVCLDLESTALALLDGDAYDRQLADLSASGAGPDAATSALLAEDARRACDELRPAFERTDGRDGYVSVDLDPRLGRDPGALVGAARRMTGEVERPNLLVKIPALTESLPAIRRCLAEGIGVHVTDVYTIERHREVMEAHLDGLEQAAMAGLPLRAIASVSALPVGALEREIEARWWRQEASAKQPTAQAVAVTTARLMYHQYELQLGGDRWRALRRAGAHPQRLMWTTTAVTGREDLTGRYVESLVGWGTISLMTEALLTAVAAHGSCNGDVLTGNCASTGRLIADLDRHGPFGGSDGGQLAAADVAHRVSNWHSLRAIVGAQLSAG